MSDKTNRYQSREVYLHAAMDIIAAQGVPKLTMRRLADHLNVSPMACYRHFSCKDELLKAALDEFILRAEVLPDADLPWPDYIDHVAGAMFEALQGEASWLPLLGRFNVGPAASRVTQEFVLKLMAAGFKFEQALHAFTGTIQLIIGSVTMQQAISDGLLDTGGELFAQKPLKNGVESLASLRMIDVALPAYIQGLSTQIIGERTCIVTGE